MEMEEFVKIGATLLGFGYAIYRYFVLPSMENTSAINNLAEKIEHQNEINEIKNAHKEEEMQILKDDVRKHGSSLIELDGRIYRLEQVTFEKDRKANN